MHALQLHRLLQHGHSGANYYAFSTLNYCCTTPLPTNGVGNITNAPLFVDYANGNLRLQSNSPCINAGNNAYVTTTTDLDGNPRIVSGTVDIGAYEYQGTGSRDFLRLAPAIRPAHGRLGGFHRPRPRRHEQLAGVGLRHQPHQRALGVAPALGPAHRHQCDGDLAERGRGELFPGAQRESGRRPFTLLATNIVGQAGTTSYTDTNAAGAGPFFYRVGVK